MKAVLSGQMPLPCIDPIIEKHVKKAARSILAKSSGNAAMDKVSDAYAQSDGPRFQPTDINPFESAVPQSIGSEYVGRSIWKELGIGDVLISSGAAERKLAVMQALDVGRLVDPGSGCCA